MLRLLLALSFGLTMSLTSFAQSNRDFLRIEQNNFPISESMLQEMDITNTSYYSVRLISKEELLKPEQDAFVKLDYQDLHKREGHSYLVSKHSYMLSRNSDFFSCELLDNLRYVRELENESALRKDKMSFHVKASKMLSKYTYEVNFFAELANCSVSNEGFSDLSKLDSEVKLVSAGSILKEKIKFTKNSSGSWSFSRIFKYPSLKSEKTLVITYELKSLSTNSLSRNLTESTHVNEMDLEEQLNGRFLINQGTGRVD